MNDPLDRESMIEQLGVDFSWVPMWYLAEIPGGNGWVFRADLRGTVFEDRALDQLVLCEGDETVATSVLNAARPWIRCAIEDCGFSGRGDSTKREDIIDCFRRWIQEKTSI